MAKLIITAPVKGWAAPLAEVPDAVFADRLLGDGVAIHPLGNTVHAPIDGVVCNIHPSLHAISIHSDEGAEILIHIGLETVAMKGAGFTALVNEGDRVARGEPLIEFDMDAIALSAKSLITPIVITNSEDFHIERRTNGQSVGVGEALMTLLPIEAGSQIIAEVDSTRLTRLVEVPLVHGIHARPAARITECARQFEAEVEAVFADNRANIRSAIGLMGLGIKMGDTLKLEAHGADAADALNAIGDLIAGGMGERPSDGSQDTQHGARDTGTAAEQMASATNMPKGAIGGVTASPGLAIGHAAWLKFADIPVAVDGMGLEPEQQALMDALANVRQRLTEAAQRSSGAQSAILTAHQALLDDPDLWASAQAQMAEGRSAGFAWKHAIGQQVSTLRNSGNARMVERADDLKDLEQQVLLALTGDTTPTHDVVPGTILLAHDLLPSQLIALNPRHIAGIALLNGGPTSHVAILSASMNIPSLAAIGVPLLNIEDGTQLVLDADAGHIVVSPDPVQLARQKARLVKKQLSHQAALATAHDQCRTADGVQIEMFANLGSIDDAELAVRNGAEGSGLLRTEFLFLDRTEAPNEDEQLAVYQAIANAMEGCPVIIRLLDIGGDKPAPYLPLQPETNPVLGLRGIRIGLAYPEVLRSQIRAILRVTPVGQCKIMLPMVASLSELIMVRQIVREEAQSLGIPMPVEVGVMIETPAAAATADLLAQHADFLSIGTNDLTQYVLAMDRENAAVAPGIDALHPAVLRMIAQTCAGAQTHGRMVGTCGGLASDTLGIPLLIGLGVTELSATPAGIPEAKALIRKLKLKACHELAGQALKLSSAADVRMLVRRFIEELN